MAVVAAIVAGVVIFGVLARRGSASTLLEKETAASAIPSVNVVYPTPSTLIV